MDNAIVHTKKAHYKKPNPLQNQHNDFKLAKQHLLVTEVYPFQSQIGDFYAQKLFLQHISSSKNRIPRQIMSLDEKYLRHWLELIHASALRPNSCTSQSKIDVLRDNFSSSALFLVSSGAEKASMSPIVGSITGSVSMMNILNSPLLRQSGDFTEDDFSSVAEDHFYRSEPLHKRLVSTSSTTTSTLSDPSSFTSSSSSSFSSLSSSSYRQAMLHCSWNDGFPHYVFSIEDQKEVYTTSFLKVESGAGYIYTFHSQKGDNEIHEDASNLVGKMVVSTSSTLCPRGAEIVETRFVLYAAGDYADGTTNTSNQILKKSKALSKKVVSMFRGNQSRSSKQPPSDEGNAVSPLMSFEANLELAAVVVKDHVPQRRKEVETGGWGLKFLKPVVEPACESCHENRGAHSSVMDIIVPAGLHGGPKTKNGGPSSLVERWRSGGSCDCGGWDVGCPLTVLNARSNPGDCAFGKSNSFDLFTQGRKESLAVMKMVNIQNGLYYTHYQSTLSALQSLSIAVAIIHTQSPKLHVDF